MGCVHLTDRIGILHGKSWFRRFLLLAVLAVLLWSPARVLLGQATQLPVLRVSGEVPNKLTLNAADLSSFQRQAVSVDDEHGTQVQYAGVPVAEILDKAGAPLGKELKGANMAIGVIALAPDGYRVLFSLMEFDAAFNQSVILLADRRDGKPLDNREGPFRLVIPGDKRHARWVRGITDLQVFRFH